MAQTVITEATTIGSTRPRRNAMVNFGYFSTSRGIIRVLQLIFGLITAAMACAETATFYKVDGYTIPILDTSMISPKLFLAVMSTTFLITSFLILFTYVIHYPSESAISKSVFEIVYNATAFVFLFISSFNAVTKAAANQDDSGRPYIIAASVFGMANSLLYIPCFIIAIRLFRGD